MERQRLLIEETQKQYEQRLEMLRSEIAAQRLPADVMQLQATNRQLEESLTRVMAYERHALAMSQATHQGDGGIKSKACVIM